MRTFKANSHMLDFNYSCFIKVDLGNVLNSPVFLFPQHVTEIGAKTTTSRTKGSTMTTTEAVSTSTTEARAKTTIEAGSASTTEAGSTPTTEAGSTSTTEAGTTTIASLITAEKGLLQQDWFIPVFKIAVSCLLQPVKIY